MIFRKKEFMHLLDLTLLQSASKYDLSSREERERSTVVLERLFFKAIEAIEPDLFLEVGAWEASASLKVKKASPDTTVVAYEANPYTHTTYKKKLKSKDVDYRYGALANKSGFVEMNIRLDADGKHDENVGNTSMTKSNEFNGKYEVVSSPAVTIDQVVSGENGKNIALWIDVEGSQKDVLPGAKNALKKAAIVFIEVEEREYWKNQWLKPKIDSLMISQGLYPIARDYQSRYQHNVIYISQEARNIDLISRRLQEFYSGS